MVDIETLIKNIDAIETSVRETSASIFHSTPMTSYSDGPQLDLRDLIGVIGPITGRNVLLNGSTGVAKTHLGLLINAALWGTHNYGILQIDPSLEAEKLFNIDGEKLASGLLSEAILDTPLITSPGVLLDEVNRAPQVILNVIQHYMNNQAMTPAGGVPRATGVVVEGKGNYQFKIGTCNEGKEYDEGTFRMDPSFRRRWPLELPMNLFTPTQRDREERMHARRNGGLFVPESNGVSDLVLATYESIDEISLSPTATEFLLYLGRMNNCIKSVYKTKNESGFTVERCNGCHARGTAGPENFCGNVYAPSDATQIDLEDISRGFALVRAHHVTAETGEMPSEVRVELADVIQAFPFVGATKLGMDPAWLHKYCTSGEPYEAARKVGVNIEQRIKAKIVAIGRLMTKHQHTEDERAQILKHCKEDAWAYGLRDCDSSSRVVYKGLK